MNCVRVREKTLQFLSELFSPMLFSRFLNTINEVVIISDGMSALLWRKKLCCFEPKRCFQLVQFRIYDVSKKSISAFCIHYLLQYRQHCLLQIREQSVYAVCGDAAPRFGVEVEQIADDERIECAR